MSSESPAPSFTGSLTEENAVDMDLTPDFDTDAPAIERDSESGSDASAGRTALLRMPGGGIERLLLLCRALSAEPLANWSTVRRLYVLCREAGNFVKVKTPGGESSIHSYLFSGPPSLRKAERLQYLHKDSETRVRSEAVACIPCGRKYTVHMEEGGDVDLRHFLKHKILCNNYQ